MAVLRYLPKVKKGLGLAHFQHDFSIKKVLYLILYQWTNFQCPTPCSYQAGWNANQN